MPSDINENRNTPAQSINQCIASLKEDIQQVKQKLTNHDKVLRGLGVIVLVLFVRGK